MPTRPQHPGAALQHIPLTVPGFKGLNLQARNSLLGPEWATKLDNAVLDGSSRVSCRKGWVSATGTPLSASAQFTQMAEYRKADGTVHLIGVADDSKIYRSTDDGNTWSDVTNTATVSDTNPKMVNFHDRLILFQDGAGPIVYNGTNCSDLTDGGSEPDGNAALAAFGRVWAADTNNSEFKYCALLDDTDWSSADTGSFSMENVWPTSDNIVAIEAFNGQLVVFGSNNIVIWTDGRGSSLGIDPTETYVVDTITGIGCAARDSIQNVNGDLWFLSYSGLQSLGRLIQEKSAPLNNLSKNIQDYLVEIVNDGAQDMTRVRSVYSPEERFYLLSLPRTRVDSGGNDVEVGRCFCFDTRGLQEDGSARVMGHWIAPQVPTNIVRRYDGTLLFSLIQVPGEVGEYTGYQDDGAKFLFQYESGWIDITGTQGYLIIPKRIESLFALAANADIVLKWAFDFNNIFNNATLAYTDIGDPAEWGDALWGVGEWGGGIKLKEARVAASGTGVYIKLGLSNYVNGGQIALQQLSIFAKVGRLK